VLNDEQPSLHEWTATLERRHLADLRLPEVARALRALSSLYVERRDRSTGRHVHGALDTAGKRAAFALYYAPLHFIAVSEAVARLGAQEPAPVALLDLGCGTGAAGLAWALSASVRPPILGLDSHPWAVEQTRQNLRYFGVPGRVVRGDVARFPALKAGTSAVAAYTLNELSDHDRRRVEQRLIELTRHGGHVLILEPLARGVAPWWSDLADRITALGGRADQWRFAVEPPSMVQRLGAAAGLNYREIKLQTLFL